MEGYARELDRWLQKLALAESVPDARVDLWVANRMDGLAICGRVNDGPTLRHFIDPVRFRGENTYVAAVESAVDALWEKVQTEVTRRRRRSRLTARRRRPGRVAWDAAA